MSKLAISLLRTDNARTILGVGPILPGYTPYGFCNGAHVDRKVVLGFNGEMYMHGTSNYFLGQGKRVYSSVLMRFSSPDTLSPFLSGGLNSYCYCRSDPVNFTDPDGKMPWRKSVGKGFLLSARRTRPVGVDKPLSNSTILRRDNPVKARKQRQDYEKRLRALELEVDGEFDRMSQAGSLQGKYTEFEHIERADLDLEVMLKAKSLVKINYGDKLTIEKVHEWTTPGGSTVLDTAHFVAMIDYYRALNKRGIARQITRLETLRKQYIMKHAHKYPKPNSLAAPIDPKSVRH